MHISEKEAQLQQNVAVDALLHKNTKECNKKKDIRRLKNRLSAIRSRARKEAEHLMNIERIHSLEAQVKMLDNFVSKNISKWSAVDDNSSTNTKKRKAANLAKAEEDLAKHRAPPKKRKPKPVQPPPSTDLLPLLITSNPYNKCVDLLKNDEFVERSKSLFANLKTDFTLNELTNIDVLEKSVRLRLSNHVRLHTGMTPAQKTSYVWDYASENLAQGLAWRVMQRLVDISDEVMKSGDDMQRYMHLPNTGLFAPMPTEGTALFGCYLTYDSTNDVWVRSGKAVNLKNRKAQHDTAMTNLLKSSLFYQTFRHRWVELSWFATTAWTQQQAFTSTTVMHMSKATVAGLERAKWGGVAKNRLQRETELAAYLCELVDDLLLDPRYTGYSEGPGFESPMCYVKARK